MISTFTPKTSFKEEFEKTLVAHGFIDKHGKVCFSKAYTKCQMDKQKFSYIKNQQHVTKYAFYQIAVGLGFTLEETTFLLHKLGFCFSDADVLDLIIRFYLEDGNPDIYEVDEELKRHGLPSFLKEDEYVQMAS